MKRHQRTQLRLVRKALPAALALIFGPAAWAAGINDGGNTANLPTGGVANSPTNVTSATVAGSAMSIGISGHAVIDWSTFNIGSTYTVNFNGSGGAVLNRVAGGNAANGSTIAGTLNGSNLAVMLMNPNGIAFTSSAVVNVGALVATTGTINESTFLSSGNAAITGAIGSITNAGHVTASGHQLTASNAGLVALVAPSVANQGVITATGGKILLAGADAATISMNNGLYEFAVTGHGTDVTNAAGASLNGATIYLSTSDAVNLLSATINLEGVQQATSAIVVNGGTVELTSALQAASVSGSASVVNVHKTASASGRIQDGVNIANSGGTVNVDAGTFAENLSITKALTLKGAGTGTGGSIIDPVSGDAVTIGGNLGASATLLIDGFTFQGAPRYGVNVAGNTILGELTIQNSDFLGNGQNGFALLGSSTAGVPGLAKVSLMNDRFDGNGAVPTPSSLGYGDILFNFYNGDAAFQDLHVTGNGEFIGIQIRGASPTSNHPMAAGVMTFDNVTIDGSFLRPAGSAGTWNPGGPGDAIHLQEYSSVANISFNNVVIDLGAGYGMFLEGLGSTLHLGNTTFGANTNLSPLGTGAVGTQVKISRNVFVGSNDNGLVTNVDATAAVFTGATSGFAIEDRVFHALDAAGLGLVTWDPGNAYVTQASGSIQRGIDAACTCTTVHVGAGTFAEQLTIDKSLTLVGAGSGQTIVSPTSLAADASGMKSILTIGGSAATSVDMSGFTFKGPVPELNAGIFVRDGAYAHIHGNSLVDMRESAALSGVQRGIGIFVGRALLATSGSALIEDNVITGYQKGGIVIDGPGSQATVAGNVVTGEGPTSVTAQNGIQISRGASATVSGNTVSGNNYTPTSDEAVGILVFTPGANLAQGSITIGPNNVSGNEVGVWTNDPRTLSSISLSGVSGNLRDGVADFGGGYAGQGALLEYPAWLASNAALVNAGTFGAKQSGDIVDAGGALRVTGWSGFAAIQPALNAVAAGASIDVASGTYAESVVLNAVRNLTFNGVTLQDLTISSGAAGSGIGGSVTASGPGGFLFNAPVRLLGDTSLVAGAGNITLNGDVQGGYALALRASGDVSLVSGGTQASPLGHLDVTANNFTLTGSLWVSGYDISALGTVALSGHTLNSLGGAPGSIDAGGDVTGHTTSDGPVNVDSGGSVTMQVSASAPVEIHADGPANVSGSAPSLVIDAPRGSVSGSFGDVTNVGSGLIDVNGTPQLNATLAASADNNRVLPAQITTAASAQPDGPPRSKRRRKIADAQEVLDNGEALELDLSPSND